jgi:hypothetical protein
MIYTAVNLHARCNGPHPEDSHAAVRPPPHPPPPETPPPHQHRQTAREDFGLWTHGLHDYEDRCPAARKRPPHSIAAAKTPPRIRTVQEPVPIPEAPPLPAAAATAQQKAKIRTPVLRQRYAGTRFEEQRQLHLPQKHKATVADSTLRVEMNGLEEQADNAKARELFWKPLSWLGTIRPTSAHDAFYPELWETFVSTTLGLEVPILAVLPRLHNSPLAKYCCKKFCMDFHGNHTSTCTAH